MNKKIKEIDIKAFRAYKDIQKFDFLHRDSGTVADLVAIYAPNGYGKTSFFDAVEWAITGNIERLSTGKPIKEEVKNEADYILKNRDANEEYGTVTIISEENDVYCVNTKKKTGKMKGDFKPGEEVKIDPGVQSIYDEKESFCTTNLLAHDKITGFLQNYTAQDKTNELRVMWDVNNYSNILNDITELYKELEKKKDQLTSDLSKEEKELKKYKFENGQSDKIIKLLSEYEIKYNKHFMDNSSFEIEQLILLFNQFHEKSKREQEEKEKECNDIEILINDYPVFEENQKKQGLLKKTQEEYSKAIDTSNKIERIKKEQEKIEKEIEQIRYLLDSLEEFYSCIDQKKRNMKELNNIENSKINCQREKINIAQKIQELNEKLKQNNAELEKLNAKEKQLKEDYYAYNGNKLKKDKYKRLSDKAKFILEQRNKRIKEWSLSIEQIDLFLAGKLGIGLLLNIFTNEIIVEYHSIEKVKAEQKLLIENNNTLENNKKNLVELFDKIEQLSIKGRDIVIEQKKHECPLCHMEYQDYNELLDRISVATEENTELVRIDEQIQKNKKRQCELDEELKRLVEDAEGRIFSISNTYKDKYTKESKKIKNIQIKKEIWEKNFNNALYICNTLEEKYQQEKIDISKSDQLINNEMIIKKGKRKIQNNIEILLNSVKEEKDKEKESEQKMQFCDLRVLEVTKLNNNINTKEMYIKVKTCLEDKEFFDPKYNCIEMRSIIESYKNQLLGKKGTIDKELADYHLADLHSKDEYMLKLDECYKEMNGLQVEISSYLQRCEKLIGITDQGQLLTQINQVNGSCRKGLKIVEEKIQRENSILTGLNQLKEQKMWMSKKQSIESDKIELNILTKRVEKLQKSKSYVEDYIMNKTNEYFNSDIINQIYNKIDPHPTMKHIKFITEKDKDGLKTRIYTYDESESNRMSPVVYLSSAQVNILSLCIFLSKVLSEKNATFNTIFIDDPIQHLDGINLLSFIDVLRTITTDLGRQIVISTHNEQFYKLLKVKMDERYYPSKFIELTSTGKVKV